jgi:hypothetical protein
MGESLEDFAYDIVKWVIQISFDLSPHFSLSVPTVVYIYIYMFSDAKGTFISTMSYIREKLFDFIYLKSLINILIER